MIKNSMSSSVDCIKSCLPGMTAADAEIAVRCIMGISRKRSCPGCGDMGLAKEQFIEKYLADKDGENRYQTQNAPCDFLDEDGNCCLGDCRPEAVRNIHIRISRADGRAFTVCWM